MAVSRRILPGLAALVLSCLAGLSWNQSGQESLFTASHMGSIILGLSAPLAFVFVGRRTDCRSTFLKPGAILLVLAALPVLLANGIHLFAFGSAEASAGDIGGIFIMLLGWTGLLAISLVLTAGGFLEATRRERSPGNTRAPTRR
jgi:hypothetical protein